jgi:arylsulfatase A-like enzyme
MQRYLQDAGYRTAISGKFLNQWGPDEPPPYFDRWAIFLQGEYYDRQWNIDGEVGRLPDYTNDVVRDKALEFLRSFEASGDSDPWFLYVGTNAGHAPFTPEQRYRDALPGRWAGNPATSEQDISDKPELIRTSGRRRYVRRNQLRTLMSADDTIGILFDELRRTGELGDTLAIFMSDNGMLWGEHGYTGKRLPYEPSVNIPLILRWPGRVDAGVSDALVANIDVAPTVLDAAGVAAGHRFDGRSLLASGERSELFLEHWQDADTSVPDWASVLSRRAQYIEYYDEDGSVRLRGYYNLMTDPWQLNNLLGDGARGNDPDTREVERSLDGYRECVAASCP